MHTTPTPSFRSSSTPSTPRLQRVCLLLTLGILGIFAISAQAIEPVLLQPVLLQPQPSPEPVWRTDVSVLESSLAPKVAARVERAWRATVPIETRTVVARRFARASDLATGVVVLAEDDWTMVLTSAHAVGCAPSCRITVGLDTIGLDDGADVARAAARVVWFDDASDLALLRVTTPPGIRPTVLALPTGDPPVGDPGSVLALGFPTPSLLEPPHDGERRRRLASGHRVESREGFGVGYRGSATGRDQGRLEGATAHLHTVPLIPGASGGPLIDAVTGRWLGLHVGSLISTRDGRCAFHREQGACLSLSVDVAGVATVLEGLVSAQREGR